MNKIENMLLMTLFFYLFTIRISTFMINKKVFSEFLIFNESAIILEGEITC